MNTLVICEGPVFGPVQKLNEIVTWRICMLSRSWIYPNFHPKLMITWISPLVHLQTARKPTFGPVHTNEGGPKLLGQKMVFERFINHVIMNSLYIVFGPHTCSNWTKASLRTVWRLTKSGIRSRDKFRRKIRVDQMRDIMHLRHVSHRVTWLSHPISELDRKLDPCVVKRWDSWSCDFRDVNGVFRHVIFSGRISARSFPRNWTSLNISKTLQRGFWLWYDDFAWTFMKMIEQNTLNLKY